MLNEEKRAHANPQICAPAQPNNVPIPADAKPIAGAPAAPAAPKPKGTAVYKLMLLAAAAIWGMGTVVIKATVDEFPPTWLVGVRFTAAGILLALISFRALRARLDADHWKAGAALGVFVFLSYWANSSGLADTTASNSAFLTTLYVVIIPFLGWALTRKRPTRYNVTAAFVCIAGVGCVAYTGAEGFSLRMGDLITLLSALFLSIHVLLTAKFAPGRDMTVLTVVQFLTAGVLGLIVAAVTEPTPDFAALSADTWISIGYLAVFASCLALLMQNLAVARVDPAPASLFLATESVFGVVFAILFLGDVLTLSLFAGFVLIFGGIVISEVLPQWSAGRGGRNAQEADGLPESPGPDLLDPLAASAAASASASAPPEA